MADDDVLLGVLLRFARTLVRDYRARDVLPDLCDDMCKLLAVDGAGVMLEDEQGDLRFVAASDDTVARIEQLQLDAGEGPCIRAYQTRSTVMIEDLTTTDQLPAFAPLAVAEGMHAVFSFAMALEDLTIGAFNLYRRQPSELDDEAARLAQVLADMATTYIVSANAVERSTLLASQLQQALDSRVVIEQAKGVLSAAWAMPVDDAFERMRRYARDRSEKLREVAARVVAGELPPSEILTRSGGTRADSRR